MMEIERNKSSVIEKLMGLEAVPRRVYRQQKVFSEKYLQKSASIGSCEKRLSKIRHRSRPKIDKSSRNDYSFDRVENLKRIDYAETAVLRPNIGNVKNGSIPSFLVDSCTVFGWEYKKQLLERSKRTKVCEEIWSSKRVCNVVETRLIEEVELKQKLELGTRVVFGSNEGWKDKSVTKLPILKRFNLSSGSNIKCKNVSKGEFGSSTGRGMNVFTKSKNVVEFSCSSNTSFDQDSTCEKGFTPFSLMDDDDELLRKTGEGLQPSPNSVLEPDNFSSSEYGDIGTDLHGLWIKLQVLVSESEENESKPEIVTLSDGDSAERTFCVSQSTENSRSLGPKQSQQFSYLVNVLNELRFHDGKMEISYKRFHSPGHIMNPLVFETLEKIYGKQKSWNRADRQLLFDRINLGLSEIAGSKPLSRKMCNFLRRDIIEEQLWNILLGQERQVDYELSEKAVGKEPWLELDDEVDSIVVEIEEFLFNELATELVTS